MLIRPYASSDAAATLEAFRLAVDQTARTSYSDEQVTAWLGRAPDLEHWDAARSAADSVVAEVDGVVAGYSDHSPAGYVDHLFVHPAFGRRGIGSALLAHVVDRARSRGIPRLDSRASLVALPVFERAGFVVVERETVTVTGVPLDRFVVELRLETV